MHSGEPRFGSIILAAGGSSRLGQPKQLLSVGGETLLRRAARAAIEAGSEATVVVLGALPERMTEELDGLPVVMVRNDAWETGMASSLRAGLATLLSAPSPPDAAAVLLCDQPGMTADTIRALFRELSATRASAAVSRYAHGAQGPPCVFAARLFPHLQTLEGQSGAKQILARLSPDEIAAVPFPEGAHDIDTPEDWQRFQERHRG